MKSITPSKFWQMPFALKLVSIYFFLLGLERFWKIGSLCIDKKCVLGDGSIIFGIIYIGLAIGLVNKSDESRTWAAFLVFLGLLGGLFFLAIAVFPDPAPTGNFQIGFSYDKFTRVQTIIALVAFLIINAGVLFTLIRPATKAFFASQTIQEEITQ
jgi:hypothetical protein